MAYETDPVRGAIDSGIEEGTAPEKTEEQIRAERAEENAVKEMLKEYNQARDFDKSRRAKYARDRSYASGRAGAAAPVNTNLIGNFIDILVSVLYARNPDVSVSKSARVYLPRLPGELPPPDVNATPEAQDEQFARTMEIVISTLFRKSVLKPSAKKMVRSGLTTGIGVMKATLISDEAQVPELRNQQNDLRNNLQQLVLAQQQLQNLGDQAAGYAKTEERKDAKQLELENLITSLENRIEVSLRRYLAIDFVASQDFQVSLDVASIDEHMFASWNANAVYRTKKQLLSECPRLTEKDLEGATCYYLRQQSGEKMSGNVYSGDAATADEAVLSSMAPGYKPEDAEQYSKTPMMGSSTTDQVEFYKVIELWNKDTDHIYTMVDGVNKWAREPYQPAWPSSRFYPFFLLSFYDVDGDRHPQSLPERLEKLQDEYACTRSNWRVSRQRNVSGVLFNKGAIKPDDVRAVTKSTHQEFTGVELVDPTTPMQNIFMQKPTGDIDPRVFDTTPILQDMEKVSGVQEARQASSSQQKTATQVNVEEEGFASRTTSDRDTLEGLLTDLANYVGEQALSAIPTKEAQRMAGPGAFWPYGMDIDDLLTMVNIEIKAGTTGKPQQKADQNSWGIVLPLIKEAMVQIQAAESAGNFGLANAMKELLRETMRRMGDNSDIERFIPAASPVPAPPLGDPAAAGALPPPDLTAPPADPTIPA